MNGDVATASLLENFIDLHWWPFLTTTGSGSTLLPPWQRAQKDRRGGEG